MKGYKVFNSNWTCKGFQYEVGKIYKMEEMPELCKRGFHFCEKIGDCFSYYNFDPSNKVAKIEALGDIDRQDNDSKCCTNKIKIVKELSWPEVLELVNTGKGNSGHHNSGSCNSGDYNSGNFNSGDRNSGNRNSGNFNSGDRNSGDYNDGNCNSGNFNSGDRNSGDYNSGDYNDGDFNSGNYNNGVFNTIKATITINMFNKPSEWTHSDWKESRAYHILSKIPERTFWVNDFDMSDEEKKRHKDWEVMGGYLKILSRAEYIKTINRWWKSLDGEDRQEVMSLPNFDKEIFKEITGIEVDR